VHARIAFGAERAAIVAGLARTGYADRGGGCVYARLCHRIADDSYSEGSGSGSDNDRRSRDADDDDDDTDESDVLSECSAPTSARGDYINASYIDGEVSHVICVRARH
jgi:hypothetical protein